MFESLQERLGSILSNLTGRGALSEADVSAALREVRRALIEADVALEVVRSFTDRVRTKAVGAEVLKSIKPGQMVVKIVQDQLVELLGGTHQEVKVGGPPGVVLMTGLQGSGKTTTSAKLAKRFRDRERRKVLLASLDVQRPAAQRQLEVLAEQVGVTGLPIIMGQKPTQIATRAMETARREGYDVVILDTAGRLHVDDELMAELAEVRDLVHPHETLLVADSLTGQDAVNVAREFSERIGVTGIVLTRMDGDARGGAALSMREVTGAAIKLCGTGEKMDALETFHPERMASRILDMGDVLSLVEQAAAVVDREEAAKVARKMEKGRFDLADMRMQLSQVTKMGGLGGMMGMLPGVGKIKQQMAEAKFDERIVMRQCAIIDSMTPQERRNPQVIHASRRKRIAAGSGTTVQDVNKLLKQHRQMQDMMKKMKKAGGVKQFLQRNMPPGMMPG